MLEEPARTRCLNIGCGVGVMDVISVCCLTYHSRPKAKLPLVLESFKVGLYCRKCTYRSKTAIKSLRQPHQRMITLWFAVNHFPIHKKKKIPSPKELRIIIYSCLWCNHQLSSWVNFNYFFGSLTQNIFANYYSKFLSCCHKITNVSENEP